MIPFAEAVKFFKSDYFTESKLAQMKPRERRVITIAKTVMSDIGDNFEAKIITPFRGPTVGVRGITFIISTSGTVRLWLDRHGVVSSNENVVINPDSVVGVNSGVSKFLSKVLIQNLETTVDRFLLDNLESLGDLKDDVLKNSGLISQVIYRASSSGKKLESGIVERLIQLYRRNSKILSSLVSIIDEPKLLQRIINFNLQDADGDGLYQTISLSRVATPEIIKKAITKIEKRYAVMAVLSKVNLSGKDLKEIYFDENSSDELRAAVKSNPNFGDIVGDEGGILSDWF